MVGRVTQHKRVRTREGILRGENAADSLAELMNVWAGAIRDGFAFKLGGSVAKVAHNLIWYRVIEPPEKYTRPDGLPLYGTLSR